MTFCWWYGEPVLPRVWQILSRHFTLYVMRRVWVVTLHCMLWADSESSLYIVCYVQILSHHFTSYVMCRFWVITLHRMLCADSESSLYIVCCVQSLSRHFTLYVVRRVWVITLHCMLCADCESSHDIGCYAEIVSRHFTLYVVRRVWVVTLRCMLCAESESSLYIVCYVQNSQGSMVNAMAFPAGPEPENQRRLELSPHHPAWDRSGCILFGLYIFSRSRRNINLLMYMPSGTKHSGGQPVYAIIRWQVVKCVGERIVFLIDLHFLAELHSFGFKLSSGGDIFL